MQEQRTDTDARLDKAHFPCARLGYAYMERIIANLRDKLICFDSHRDIGGLERNNNIIKIALLKQAHMSHCAVHKSLCGGSAVFGENILLDRAAVDANPYRDTVIGAGIGNSLDSVFRADVAGIDAYFINARRDTFERKSVIKMYIRDYRHFYCLFESRDELHRIHIGYCGADYLASGFFESLCLLHAALNIMRGDIEHRLDGYRRVAADSQIAYSDLFAFSAFKCHNSNPLSN